MADKYVNEVGVQTIKAWIEGKFALDTDLDALAEDVQELITEGGEPNTIESISVNGTPVVPDVNKNVALTVPTATSDLTNDGDGDSPFATEDYVDENGGKIDTISVNNTPQTITNKNVNITMPTKVSDLTNDGDGTTGSQFATKTYVDQNGGKIDVIKVNGTAQTITNKEVDLVMPTKLSDLTNDGDGTTGSTFPTTAEMETAIESAVVGALKPKGSIAFANLPALTAANLNNMYDITDSFTTTADFTEGAGHSYPAGTEVAIINAGTDANPVYKYSVMVGIHDMAAYWTNESGKSNSLIAMTTAEINAILEPSA